MKQSDDESGRLGRFWIAGSDVRANGVFYTPTGGSPRVELSDELTPAFKVVEEGGSADAGFWQSFGPADAGPRQESLILHGEFAGRPREVTLVDCFTYHRRFQLFGAGVAEHSLRARYALVGCHLSKNELTFDGVRFEISSLAEWACLSGFDVSGQRDGSQCSVNYVQPASPEFRLASGARLKIVPEVHPPLTVGAAGVTIKRRVYAEITGGRALTWQEVDKAYARPLISYLQLCTGGKVKITGVQVKAQQAWVPLVALHIGGSEPVRSPAGITLPDTGIHSLGEWLDCVEDIGPIPAVVSDNFVGRNSSLETQLLELATVSEGLHRAIFPQRNRLEAAEAWRIKSAVRAAVAGESQRARNIINGRFSYIEQYREVKLPRAA